MKILKLSLFIFVSLLSWSCTIGLRHSLPSNYDGIVEHPRYDSGNIYLIHLGGLVRNESISFYINNQLILPDVSSKYHCPNCVETDPVKSYNHDFYLIKKYHKIFIICLKDPQKEVLYKAKITDTVNIKAVNSHGCEQSFLLFKKNDCFFEFSFFNGPEDTLYAIRWPYIHYMD